MDEHETAIHWSCVIQEVTKRLSPEAYSTAVEYGAAVVDAASEIWAWHEKQFPRVTAVVITDRGDPGPAPPDVPYGEEEARLLREGDPRPTPLRPSSGPPEPHLCGHGPNDTNGCGGKMEYFDGRDSKGKDYAGYRCPNQKKTNDPAEQAAEKVRHPVQWINL